MCEGRGGGAASAAKERTMRLAKASLVLHSKRAKSLNFRPSSLSSLPSSLPLPLRYAMCHIKLPPARLVAFIDDIDLNGRVFAPSIGQKTAVHDRQDKTAR